MSFYFQNGFMYCEDLQVKEIQKQVPESPFYLYSLRQIQKNYQDYVSALKGLQSIIGYAVKANNNLHILKHLQNMGCGAVLVSGNELRLALVAGFDPRQMIFNGNGKTLPELILAVKHQVMVNIDSEFDLLHIQKAAEISDTPVKVLIRINPDVDANTHEKITTGTSENKFGIDLDLAREV